MLKNHCIVEYYRYDINLIKPIQYICQLAYNILSITNKSVSIKDLFTENLIGEARIDFENLPENVVGKDAVSWLADQLAVYYLEGFLSAIDLSKTQILLLHQTSRILYVLNKRNRVIDKKDEQISSNKKENIKNNLLRLIKEIGLIKNIVKKIDNAEVRACIENSLIIDNDGIYNDVVVIDDVEIPFDLPYFYRSYLNSVLVTQDLLDTSDIWVNKDKFKKEFLIEIGQDNNVCLIKSTTNEDIGICYNDYVFPIRPSLADYIQEQRKSDFYWIQIKEVFKANDNKRNHLSPLIEDFKKQATKIAFTNLLSNLKENLYLDSKLFDNPQMSSFRKFFTSSLKIDEVKYLKKLNFFINDSENPASFGIYSFEKLAEDASHFNLIHWFDQTDNGNSLRYRDNLGPQIIKDVSKVSTLKPEIAFYFITKYFEDFVQSILDTLKLEYLSNFHLYNGTNPLGEFDFLVKKANTFYFVEVKTTLTKYYIKDYTTKCLKIIQAFKTIDVNLEFIIIGAYSNTTIEDLKHYIVKSHKGNRKYNRKIDGLATVPYSFKVPIESTEKNMHCIAESNYTRLKTLLLKCLE